MAPNPKNLAYNANEPSFLRKLRSENAGLGSNTQERPIPRQKRARDPADDDGPTYVLEESNDTLSKAEYEALVKGDGGAEDGSKVVDEKEEGKKDGDAKDGKSSEQQTAGVGKVQKKRKVGKVVGRDEEQEGADEKAKKETKAKPKKKTKGVQLSFGEDGDR
ncbi:MAG: hypothetical protein M1820_001979 [Bogoriella megaspora]|nr:MAG: hypothetical protein M1820_001979 [Bogoriella megaspora]